MAQSSDVICSSSQYVAGPGPRAEPGRPFCSATPPAVVTPHSNRTEVSQLRQREGLSQGLGLQNSPPPTHELDSIGPGGQKEEKMRIAVLCQHCCQGWAEGPATWNKMGGMEQIHLFT